MTALAIFGSATRTSLTSRGKSTIADLPMPSDRKRVFVGMLEVVAGAASLSAAAAGARSEIKASAIVENNRVLINKVRMDVRLPLLAIFLVLLVTSILLIILQRRRLGW